MNDGYLMLGPAGGWNRCISLSWVSLPEEWGAGETWASGVCHGLEKGSWFMKTSRRSSGRCLGITLMPFGKLRITVKGRWGKTCLKKKNWNNFVGIPYDGLGDFVLEKALSSGLWPQLKEVHKNVDLFTVHYLWILRFHALPLPDGA